MATDAWPHIGCLPLHHQAAQKDTIFAEKAQRLKMKDWRDVKHFATGLSFDLILTSCIWANLQSHTHIFCRGKYCGKYQRLLWTIANVLLVSAVTQNISWAGFYCWLLVFLGVGSHFYGESKNALYAYFDPYLPAILQNLLPRKAATRGWINSFGKIPRKEAHKPWRCASAKTWSTQQLTEIL